MEEGGPIPGPEQGSFLDLLELGVWLYRYQIPNSTRFKAVVILGLYLGCRYLSEAYKCCHETTTDLRAIIARPKICEVPSLVGGAPEKAGPV